MHPVLGAAGPRHPRVQERLVLEEIHVPPRLGLGVVHRAGTLIAARHRTPETGAPREVQVQIQSACATSKSERVTRHGSANPKAALNRSRVSDIRPIPQHWATERHDPSWPTPRTPGRDTRPNPPDPARSLHLACGEETGGQPGDESDCDAVP